MQRNNLFTLLLFASIALFTTSCDNDTFEGEVGMNFNLVVDGENFETGKTYTVNGTAVEFSGMGFYVGGITFDGMDAQVVFEDKYLLVTPENTSFSVGDLSADEYSKLSFFIGVDEATNSMSTEDFTTRAASDPLAANEDYKMHWNWNSGYKFFAIDGMSDTDGDGTVDTPVAYHIGSNPFRTDLSFDLEGIDDETIELEFDLAKFFAGVDFTTDLDTHTGNNPELAQKLVTNYSTAFSVK